MSTLIEVYSSPGGVPTWTAVPQGRTFIPRRLTAHARGGIPTFVFESHNGAPPGLPDPWLGKTLRVTVNGTLRFLGDVARLDPAYRRGLAWACPYTAFGLRNRGDWVPHTDANDGGDSSSYNLQSDAQGAAYLPSRAGRTAGEVLLDALSGAANAAALMSVGVGNYSSGGSGAAGVVTMAGGAVASVAVAAGGGGQNYATAPRVVTVGGGPTTPAVITATVSGGAVTGFTVTSGGSYAGTPTILVTTLPATTVGDLFALTTQPPAPVYFGGEKLLSAVDAFLQTWCPNHHLEVEPGGDMRVLDQRAYTNHTFTLGTDPVRPSGISRDLSECFQRVAVRGQQLAEMFRFSTRLGTLSESPFAHDGLTVAAAKAAWVPDDYFRPEKRGGRVEGTCTCPDTLHVTITSAVATTTFGANAYDQSLAGRHGMMTLTYAAAVDVSLGAQRSVVANTAMAAGGSSTITVDRALPHLLFDHFTLTGLTQGASAVWTDYALPAWAGPKVARESYLPMPLKYAGGNAETLVSTATGVIRWSSSGSPPYQEGISGISVDTGSGVIRFNYPTKLTAGKQPDDVEVWIPIYTAVNQVSSPADTVAGGVTTRNYAGTSNTVDGLTKTLTVTVRAWRDPANAAAMALYAADLLDSVKDAVCEGEITFLGLFEPALAPGTSYSVAGTGFTTGWEGLALPGVEGQLEWSVDGLTYVTTVRVSNRRAHFSAEAFLHPDRTGVTFDWGDDVSLGGGAYAAPDVGAVLGSYAGVAARGAAADAAAAMSLPASMADLGISTDAGAPARDAAEGLRSLGIDLTGGGGR